MRKVTLQIEVEIPDGVLVESVAACRNGKVVGFTPYSEPFTLERGEWEVSRQYKFNLFVSNWKETLTEVPDDIS